MWYIIFVPPSSAILPTCRHLIQRKHQTKHACNEVLEGMSLDFKLVSIEIFYIPIQGRILPQRARNVIFVAPLACEREIKAGR